jgi:hypothetical protein
MSAKNLTGGRIKPRQPFVGWLLNGPTCRTTSDYRANADAVPCQRLQPPLQLTFNPPILIVKETVIGLVGQTAADTISTRSYTDFIGPHSFHPV